MPRPHAWIAALLVANLAMLAALILLYRLTDLEFDRATAGRTTFYLIAFPTGFYLTAAYNEGLFIALLVACVYCLRRGHWWWAGSAGALAAATRSAGILLLLAFAYEYIRTHGRTSGAFGDVRVHNLLELGTVLLLATLTVLMFTGPWQVRRDQLVLPLLGAGLLLFMVSFPSRLTDDVPYPLLPASRIGLEIFPAFMLLGSRATIDRTALALFLTVQGILVARFLHAGWVA
ncbi:hypothetical protein OHA72_16060 [Dactylosporangium sp. NBC_01737]|uniref:hypothetical protein n=1 Tax=Dactylosporangium sp. NBC_01737 TaxID=2975959 RepID=UPI002E163A4C|nr:hypothetical protein OHA72_16060 [Dactylosporangium sp. NBC_01737]